MLQNILYNGAGSRNTIVLFLRRILPTSSAFRLQSGLVRLVLCSAFFAMLLLTACKNKKATAPANNAG
jgi:hypothetical protein